MTPYGRRYAQRRKKGPTLLNSCVSRMEATKLYRHLRQHAEEGHAIRVSGGRWRARAPRSGTVSDRPGDRPVPPLARVCT